ncbi:fibro-slime domain-containing protein [Bacterioplanoides sp. SCSIO 12839]|uniref:fibro-slime domain-containing protein n=1 Tax=Bacterioplanoides sp. SCSIO 12839 TaxID=2829569 RepID=UPI00210490ED|nr:fibro-slime domain-containing protein [Bacterioplanoides sp. SCSIO 12839]UTW48439.1 fibro-slime domain-containing protein [Bacterioplanoides sp. SCSIO 12839]
MMNFTHCVLTAALAVITTSLLQASEEQPGDYDKVCTCVQEETGLRQIPVTIRDFTADHPDFEIPYSEYSQDIRDSNIIEEQLGLDGRPVYRDHPTGTDTTRGKEYFDQWYRDVPGVNKTLLKTLTMRPSSDDSPYKYTYENWRFFPIDGEGFGSSAYDFEGNYRNFHFTLETHLKFFYVEGGTFRFLGDDDLWIFINGKLAIELGGLHPALERVVKLDDLADELGIEPGNSYSFDLFFAERHTTASRFIFETSFELECL